MKVIVFGATGGTGNLVVQQLLEEEHAVTVVVRDEGRLDIEHPNLTVTQGDVLDPSSFENELQGKAIVISALGVNHRKPTTVYSEGMENILSAMNKHGVKRVLCLSSGTIALPPDTPLLARLFLSLTIKRIYRNLYADMARMEEIVGRSSLDWTIIRPPRLTDGAKTLDYRVTINEPMKNAKGIKGVSRADLADCIVKQMDNPASYQGVIDLSY